ncbi:autophagy protein Apg9 [Aspergillus luchuensis]|uniref:Autophagy protein Apg9 n=1 Tax=Aspergillus kawachii TaxID=1069201 RepID=A0A146FLB3_ASPKA|nr:autophagy protein Apg9 [Aspergillus luchuensis]
MIPPCDPVILDNNPQFKRLYTHLTTTLLNPDGSTRAQDAQPARQAVVECRDPIAIITIYLESSPELLQLDDDSHDAATDAQLLLAPDIDDFYSNLPLLATPLSNVLSTILNDLRAIANAGSSDSAGPGSTSTPNEPPRTTRARNRQAMLRSVAQVQLASQLEDRIRALRQIQLTELPAARTRMAATASEVLATRAAVLERTVMLLERAKHGAMARAAKAKADHLLAVVQGIEGKLNLTKLDILAAIHTPEVVDALQRYYQHLQNTREQLEERRATALEELKDYESNIDRAGRGPMKELARQFGSLIQEVEDVRMEIERLNV